MKDTKKQKKLIKTLLKIWQMKNMKYAFEEKQMRHEMKTVQSKFKVEFKVNKIYVSCFDDKLYILHNGLKALSYRHKDIN